MASPKSDLFIDTSSRPRTAISKSSAISYSSGTSLTRFNGRIAFTPASLLTEWEATAIAGNDLLSSILYTIGITGKVAGRWTPLSLLIVSFGVLFPFRKIYAEIGHAMPQNGGTFNLVMQLCDPYSSTSPVSARSNDTLSPHEESVFLAPKKRSPITAGKVLAAAAGVFSLLSYATTAVVSAASAVAYGAGEVAALKSFEFELTLAILSAFAILSFFGLKDSSRVAFVIFTIHAIVVGLLAVSALIHAAFVEKGSIWARNFFTSDEVMKETQGIGKGTAFSNIFFGVSIGMLGITGFETACNYIEEQGNDIFKKTLRNLWVLVTILNGGLALVTLGCVDLKEFHLYNENLFSHLAHKAVGPSFRYIVSADAVLALSGGCLTAFVGVTGLLTRMAKEGMLPSILLKKNRKTRSYQYVVLFFFALTCSMHAIAMGQLESLSGVYTSSFLGVLSIAILGCAIIRYRAGTLKYSDWDIAVATLGVLIGTVGQVILRPSIFLVFLYYFMVFMAVVIILMFLNA